MRTIDLGLFQPEPLEIKLANGTKYEILFVSAGLELKLMQEQGDISSKISKWKDVDGNDLERWKDLFKKILKEQENSNINESDINKLSPIELMTVMLALVNYLGERSKIIKQAFPQETKDEIEKIEKDLKDDLKKKMMSNP